MTGIRLQQVMADEAGMRLDRWFRRHYPALGHGALQRLLRTGQVRVDGARAKAHVRLEQGQTVRVPPLPQTEVASAARPLSQKDKKYVQSLVLYKDSMVIAINKPPGLAVQGGTRTGRHLDALLAGLQFDAKEPPRLVHRLDKETSGVLLLARTRPAAAALSALFRTRSVRKIYWALVEGVPRPAQGKITQALKKARGVEGERMRATEREDEGSQRAQTYYAVIARAGDRFTWLSVKPVTGRTHQIRAHLAEIGHPIVGDRKYGGREEAGAGIAPGLHLHARRLTLLHPQGGALDVTAPLPEHMRRTWAFLGLDQGVDFDPFDAEDG